jgi:hypothetical protein
LKWYDTHDIQLIVLFNGDNLKHLNHLVKRKPEQELNEPWDSDILFAYNSTMSLIGGALQAITAGEPEPTVGLTQKRHQLTRFFQHNNFSTTTAIVELFLMEIQI